MLNAKLQAMVDPLTGVYNRAGFEHTVEEYRNEKMQLGMVLVDIDRFKMVNDNYGHEFGDRMLQLVAEQLQHSFRNEDKVFRVGGDEFVLLLYGCGPDAWSSLQQKFSEIHRRLEVAVKEELALTLSAGFSQSDHGYRDDMMTLADEALYHTKSNGRAGLTQVDENHLVIASWNDEKTTTQKEDPVSVDIGYGRIVFDADESIAPQLFLDEVSRMVFGISKFLSPEETYAFWKGRIVERNEELFKDMKERLLTNGSANCQYIWNHPTRGEIVLRSDNKLHKSGSRREIFGYVHEAKEEDTVTSFEDGRFLITAIGQIYFNAYYFEIATGDYYVLKGSEYDKPGKMRHTDLEGTFSEFVATYVAPNHRGKLRVFMDFETMPQRLAGRNYIECEYWCRDFGWCRTRILPVKWDGSGKVTHAVSLSESMEASKQAEIAKK